MMQERIQSLLQALMERYRVRIDGELNDIGLTTEVHLTCKEHNTKNVEKVSNLLYGVVPCKVCRDNMVKEEEKKEGKPMRKNNKWNESKVLDAFEEKHGKRFGYFSVAETYKGMDSYVWIWCKEHEIMFRQTPNNHLLGASPCPACQRGLKSVKEISYN